MNKIGIVVKDLGPTDLTFTINKIAKNPNLDCLIFYDELYPLYMPPNCATINSSELYSFDGVLIATDIESAIRVSRAKSAKKKIFYPWYLDWLRYPTFDHANTSKIFNDKNLIVVSRSKEYAKRIKLSWGLKSSVIENFDLLKLMEK